MKRLLRDNVDCRGKLNTDAVMRGILQISNTHNVDSGLSLLESCSVEHSETHCLFVLLFPVEQLSLTMTVGLAQFGKMCGLPRNML